MENIDFDFQEKRLMQFEAMLTTINFLLEEKNFTGAKQIWEKVLDLWSDKEFIDFLNHEWNKDLLNFFKQTQEKIEKYEKDNSAIQNLSNVIKILREKKD